MLYQGLDIWPYDSDHRKNLKKLIIISGIQIIEKLEANGENGTRTLLKNIY